MNERVSFTLNKGDVVIFNPAVAHGTLPCLDASLTRKMMVCEWTLDEGASFFTAPGAGHSSSNFSRNNLIDITPILAARTAMR